MGAAKSDMRVRVWILALLGLALLPGASLGAEGPDDRVTLGNEAYERGDYAAAIEAYRSVLDEGWQSADLHYNLGNAYLKAGQLGRAVLHYERASRLAPGDRDVRSNLEYARARGVDAVPERPLPRTLEVLLAPHRRLGLDSTLVLASVLWWLLAAAAVAGLYLPARARILRPATLSLACLLVLALVSASVRIHGVEAHHPGIVVSEEVQVMSGPGQEYAREFVLHAGTRVDVRRTYQAWREVALSDELRGWVSAEAVEEI